MATHGESIKNAFNPLSCGEVGCKEKQPIPEKKVKHTYFEISFFL